MSPQQDTVPFEKRRQVWSQPSAMEAGLAVLVECVASTMGSESPTSWGESPMKVVFPRPSWPAALSPQHTTSWLSRMAHVCRLPASMSMTCRPVGIMRYGSVSPVSRYPSPNPSRSLYPMPMRVVSPQHLTDPFSNSAQVWLSPRAVFVMFSTTPVSTNGS